MDRSKILLHLLFAPCMAASLHVCADIGKGDTHVCASILVRTLVDIHTACPQLNPNENHRNPRLTLKASVYLKLVCRKCHMVMYVVFLKAKVFMRVPNGHTPKWGKNSFIERAET